MSHISPDFLIPRGNDESKFFIGPGTYGEEILFKTISFQVRESPVQEILAGAATVYDFGPAWGESTEAIYKLCPNVAEIYTADVMDIFDMTRKNMLSHVLRQYSGSITDFLSLASSGYVPKADIIFIISVPTHGIDGIYFDLISKCLEPNGLVIEMGDTRLNLDSMQRRFRLLAPPSQNYETGLYWQRKL